MKISMSAPKILIFLIPFIMVGQAFSDVGKGKSKQKKKSKEKPKVESVEQETQSATVPSEEIPKAVENIAQEPIQPVQPETTSTPPAIEEEEKAWLEGKEKKEIPPPEKVKGAPTLIEDPQKWYFGIGVRLRMHIIPSFVYSFAADGAYTEVGYGIGIEGIFRIKGLDIIPSIWFHDVSHEPAIMKEPDDPDTEKEYIINNMRLVMITVDFLNSVKILSWLYFFYGAGVGLGIPVTRIERWEAYPDAHGNYHKCEGPGNPPSGDYCETSGGHYGKNDPWPVYPYLNILLGLRFKPIPNFVCTFDFGVGTGFILGTRASYVF
jgi:hypothetical protein